MTRICENGIYRDATTEEIQEIEKIQQENQNQVPEKTPEERLEMVENAVQDLILMQMGGEQ